MTRYKKQLLVEVVDVVEVATIALDIHDFLLIKSLTTGGTRRRRSRSS